MHVLVPVAVFSGTNKLNRPLPYIALLWIVFAPPGWYGAQVKPNSSATSDCQTTLSSISTCLKSFPDFDGVRLTWSYVAKSSFQLPAFGSTATCCDASAYPPAAAVV